MSVEENGSGDEWGFPNAATPPGSADYYAVRFCAPQRRRLYALLLGWHGVIRSTVDRPRDPGVARMKLDWWRNEISGLKRTEPRHPLLRALREESLDDRAIAAMHQVIDAAERHIIAPQPADDAAFLAACRGDRGSLLGLVAAARPDNGPDPTAAVAAGSYSSAVSRVGQLARRPDLLPNDCTPLRLRDLPMHRRVRRLDALFDGLGPLLPSPGELPELAARMHALALALHEKLRRTGYAVHDQPIDRNPLAHLWTAWRVR